jgi:hypothetical protein
VDTVRWLAEAGHLFADGDKLVKGGLNEASVERMRDTYIAVRALGYASPLKSVSLARLLRARGVEVLSRSEFHQAVARRADVMKLMPELAAAASSAESMTPVQAALPAVLSAAKSARGSWWLPEVASGHTVSMTSGNRKATMALTFGVELQATTDCTPTKSSRRARILEASSSLPPGFSIVRSRGVTHLEARTTCNPDAPGGVGPDQEKWIQAALEDLYTMFGPAKADPLAASR